jgi:predicted transport protein
MPLFKRDNQSLTLVKRQKFENEKELQNLVENNLEIIFNSVLIQSEFQTGSVHAGRIDSLAISEDNNPVIIEYKVVESSQLLNQSLYYLAWLKDHKGDFQVAAEKACGKEIVIDWSSIRVICIAPGYKKYDLHAVKVMDVPEIELWQYKYFENGVFELEEIYGNSIGKKSNANCGNSKVELNGANSSEVNVPVDEFNIDWHLRKANQSLVETFYYLQEKIVNLDSLIEERPKKNYIAYKLSQNFVCTEVHKNEILLFLKVNPDDIEMMPENARNVRDIGHFGTGDLEIRVRTISEIDEIIDLIEWSYRNING